MIREWNKDTPLSDKESQILKYICHYIDQHNKAPTQKEIAEVFQFTPTAANQFIEKLCMKERIKKDESKRNRNIIVLLKA